MPELKNSDIIKGILKALYVVASRRTTQNFAVAVIGAITRTLGQRYDFLKHVIINSEGSSEDILVFDSDLNSVDAAMVGKAIEAIIQIVYMDLKEKAGLYFIKEVKRNLGEEIISNLKDVGVDLELLQLQQHYLYRRGERPKETGAAGKGKAGKQPALDNASLLGYSWENVSSWNFDSEKKVCTIYGKDGKKLDELNLDTIIKNYIGILIEAGVTELPSDFIGEDGEDKIGLDDKELRLLKMLYDRDVDLETAITLLRVSHKDLEYIIRRLLTLEMLQFISSNEVELTEIGIAYMKAKEKEKEEKAKERIKVTTN